jgi:hypothetical protein
VNTWQFGQTGVPLSTGPVEEHLRWLRESFKYRRYSFRNQERMNRLLKLIQLYKNRQADPTTYARIIRAHLLTQGGVAAARKQINNHTSAGDPHTLRP